MHAGRRLARRAGRAVGGPVHAAAQRVVEDEHLAGAGRLRHHALHLGIIHPPHLVLVPEVADRALVVQYREALAVERDVGDDRTNVMYRHGVRFALRVRTRHAGRRIEGIVARPFGHRREVVQRCLDVRQVVEAVGVHRSMLLGLRGGRQPSTAAARARTVWPARDTHRMSWRRNPPAHAD